MRCNNCGWDNQNDAFNCIKCDSLLVHREIKSNVPASSKENQYSGTIIGAQLPSYLLQEETAPPQASISDETHVENNIPSLISCSYADCGYMFSKEITVCPKCNRPVDLIEASGNKRDDASQLQQLSGKAYSGTIDPYRKKAIEPEPTCYLTQVSKTGESDQTASPGILFRFNNTPIELTRDNLDPGNKTITSKVQAEIIYEDGVWYLLDKSELNTTFIVVRNKTQLMEGDIILMGDRKFVFTYTNNEIMQ